MAWRKAVLAAGTFLLIGTSSTSWAGFSPYEEYSNSYDPYDYEADSHDPHWLMDESSGCWAYDSNAGPKNSITWSGDCRNGRADGDGTLTFFERRRPVERLTGTFADGMLQDGHVAIEWSDGSSYVGEEMHGQFNGYGVLIATDGTHYDGRWQDDNFVGPSSRNPYLTGNGGPDDEHAPDVADNTPSQDENDGPPSPGQSARADQPPRAPQPPAAEPQPAQQQLALAQPTQPQTPSAHWTFLDGLDSKLAAVDGSELSFSIEPGSILKRTVVHADGSVGDTTFTPDTDIAGTVRNPHGDLIANYRLDKNSVYITYDNGRTETIAANGAGGLTVTTTPPGGLSIKSDWYPENRMATTAQNNASPEPTPPPPAASPKLSVASLAPPHATPAVHAATPHDAPPRVTPIVHTEAAQEEKRVAKTRKAVREARLVRTPFHPDLKPAAPVDAPVAEKLPENLPRPDLKPAPAPEDVAENFPRPDVKPAPPPEQVQVAENLRAGQKPTLRVSKKHDRHHEHSVAVADTDASPAPEPDPVEKHDRHHAHGDAVAVADAAAPPVPQPVEMHSEQLPPVPEVHTVAIPDLHIAAAAPPPPPAPRAVPAVSRVASAAAAPPAVHVSNVLPAAPPPTTPVHIAGLHTIGAQEPALRKSASDCLTVESNGTHWGFRNNCVADIQFAYCVKNGADRLTACNNSAVPGSVAAHGFTSLIADLSLKDPSASHAFRWVACLGGAGEVVPRLDQSDPPMGRCLHATDLPAGAERAEVMKRGGK